jgi:hypothetical protein
MPAQHEPQDTAASFAFTNSPAAQTVIALLNRRTLGIWRVCEGNEYGDFSKNHT